MKLREANKTDNRAFHELTVESRIEFLLDAFAQVFSRDAAAHGEFTPIDIKTVSHEGPLTKEQLTAIHSAVNKLNFLMTRFTLEAKPDLEGHIEALALLRFEYLLLTGDVGITSDPQLIADFYTKRERTGCIRPALERMGERAISYEFLAKEIIHHPVFVEHLGDAALGYSFRSKLHLLVSRERYSREQTAKALINEGFDLIACDFNRWYAHATERPFARGDKKYEPNQTDTAWLTEFVAHPPTLVKLEKPSGAGASQTAETTSSPAFSLPPVDNEVEEPSDVDDERDEFADDLHADSQELGNENDDPATITWIRTIEALTADHEDLALDPHDGIATQMWNHLWCGQFAALAYQLKGANPSGRTRNGLQYNKWALLHEVHGRDIDPILAQNSFAMIIAADILVGDLTGALDTLTCHPLQMHCNHVKVEGAINLAWHQLHEPGESDNQDEDGEYRPPYHYLIEVADAFGAYLRETPSAAPYIRLLTATAEVALGEEERKILNTVTNRATIARLYKQLGLESALPAKYLENFATTFDRCTEFSSLLSETQPIAATVNDEHFRRTVGDDAISNSLIAGIEKNQRDKKSGIEKFALSMYRNPTLQPFLKDRLDLTQLLNGMIDNEVGADETLLLEPLSLRSQGELTITYNMVVEAYLIADSMRELVDPVRMKRLVSYLLALSSDLSSGNGIELSLVSVGSKLDTSDSVHRDLLPTTVSSNRSGQIDFLSKIYEREKILGGLDPISASIGVTNVIFRGTYVQPTRFYPLLDAILGFLKTPVAELLPSSGLGLDAVKEYLILNRFLEGLS